MKRIPIKFILIANRPTGSENGSFPHSNGANFTGVGFFFPSVELNKTINAVIPPANTELTAIPMYSFITCMTRRQYTSLLAVVKMCSEKSPLALGEGGRRSHPYQSLGPTIVLSQEPTNVRMKIVGPADA